MTQFLLIGCLESEEELAKKISNGYKLVSAQNSQKSIIEGLEKAYDCVFDSLNGSVPPPYPLYKEKRINRVVWSHARGSFDVSVGFKNVKYLNRIYCTKSLKREAQKWIRERYADGNDLIVIAYSMRSSSMETASFIKRKIPTAKLFLIVTDLPEYMDLGQSKVKKFLKKIDGITINKCKKSFDGFILYSRHMSEALKLDKNKWIEWEGSYQSEAQRNAQKNSNKAKAIMYSGMLDYRYGIPLLLESFIKIPDEDAELWLTGDGNCTDLIKQFAAKDKRIKFYGFLPSRNSVKELQQRASILVNMRLPSEPASKYCFPSKLFEYMLTGVPVLSFKIGGIPQDYYDHLIVVDREDSDGFSSVISRWLNASDSEKNKLGDGARKFVLEEKNNIVMCEKLRKFIEERRS